MNLNDEVEEDNMNVGTAPQAMLKVPDDEAEEGGATVGFSSMPNVPPAKPIAAFEVEVILKLDAKVVGKVESSVEKVG